MAVAAEGRFLTSVRLGVRAGDWSAESGEQDYLYSLRGIQQRLAELDYLNGSDVTGSADYLTSRRCSRFRAGRTSTAREP